MSASALKSTMQGVGSSPPPSGHSILPMNVVAQKVVPGTESSASMKPLSNSGMSYTMLQPPTNQQPMSLVQDHRSQVYQNQSFNNNSTSTTTATTTVTAAATTTTTTAAATVPAVSSTQAITTAGVTTTTTTTTTLTATSVAVEKDSAAGDKLITNGVEPTTTPPTNDPESIEQNKQNQDTNRNNNQSPDNTTPDTQQDGQKKTEARPIVTDTSSSAEIQITKVEESSKTPVNNGSKETEASVTVSSAINEKKTDEKIVTTPVKVENDTLQVVVEKIEQKSPTTPRSTQKRKSREIKDIKTGNDGGKPKRNRVQTQPYQSPLPEIALIVKETMKKSVTPNKNPDDKLIVFYKNEFLAVRNSEGSFYVCQAMQNIYKSSRRIRIRWLSQDKNNGEIYSPDFYDFTDFDCILTNLNLNKIDKNKYQLTKIELLRTENILKRAIDVEAGVSEKPSVTEEHPDGLDLSLFKDESQLKRRKGGSNKTPKRQRKRSKQDETSSSSDDDDDEEDDDDDDDTSSSDEDDDKKTNSKTSRSKRTTNKALALAKSLVKVPNRANRALLRGTRTNPIENSPSTADVKKPEVKKTTSPTTSTASTSPRTKLRGPVQSNEQESSNNLTTGRAKRSTAVAAAAAAAAAASATTTTATTTAATTGVSSTDNSSTRKKSQGST